MCFRTAESKQHEESWCRVWHSLLAIFVLLRRKKGGRRLMEHHGETLVGFNGAVAGAPGAVGGARSPADSKIET